MVQDVVNDRSVWRKEAQKHVSFNGIEDIIEKVEYVNSTSGQLKILIDAKNSEFDFGMSEIGLFEPLINHFSSNYKEIKVAIVVDDPVLTIMCMVYSQLFKNQNVELQTFSTAIYAKRWLRLKDEVVLEGEFEMELV